MGCLICKRTLFKTSTLNACCGDSSRTIKDCIIEFVGDSIAGYLVEDSSRRVCIICQHMLDEIVKFKFEMLRGIPLTEPKNVPKLGKYWDFCSKYADYNTFEFTCNAPEPRSRDPTPIMSVTRTKMYNVPVEQIFETREGLKTELRNNHGRKIGLKSERVNRSKSAIIDKLKQDIKERTQRGHSEPQDRSISVASNMSVISSASNVRERDTFNDQLTEAYREELRKTCKCPYEECKDLDLKDSYFEYTSHMIEEHNAKAYFKCDECGFEYLKKEHLKIHSLKHDVFPVLCGICGNQTPNVSAYQEHAEKHLASSFKCIVCDMAFCTKKECNKHIFSNHRQRRRIFLRRKASQLRESIILNQIDHKKTNSLTGTTIATSENPVNSNKCREMKITCNEPEQFRKKTFRELDFIQRHPPAEWNPVAFSLGDSVIHSENLDERINATLADSGKVSDIYDKVPNRANYGRDKSGRTTPFQRSETPFSEDLDMPPFVGTNNYYKTSRELESRSTEVAKYMNGDEDSDANSETQEVESDFESENQYLDGNTFLSSIPSPYSSIDKS